MNWPEAIEKALRDTFAEYAPPRVDRAWLRCQQDQADHANPTARQLFPQVLFQCSPRYPESDGATWAVDVDAICATWADDDPGFRCRAALFEDVETFFRALLRYRSFRDPPPEAFAFASRVAAEREGFRLGGITITNPGAPQVAEGVVGTATFSATIHFSVDGE